MQIRAFAEQVLFGDTLADKLVDPGRLADAEPGPALATIPDPGRPLGLGFEDRSEAERVKRPGTRALQDPLRAGRLLHAFANHELLAAELMALVLLRFPEAPAPFRRALAMTLQEEQLHLSLYIERMGQLGVEFGELPVNRFFWNCVADVPTPMDFAVRMGLVFEQANLDFTAHFAGLFRQVGDEATAALLDRVHADEVGHVRHGLHWFRQWKEPELDEWTAFRSRLVPPLGPSRAKAPGYDRALRERIGFQPAFLDRLEVWGRTRGRPPVVWCFEPGVEEQIAAAGAGRRWQPRAGPGALARDLAGLLGVLAGTGDMVLVGEAPSAAFLRPWLAAGLPEVEWMPAGDPVGTDLSGLEGRTLGGLQPWGRSPAVEARLGRLRAQFAPESVDRSPWSPELERWSRKSTVVGHLGALQAGLEGGAAWLAGAEVEATVASSEETVLIALAAILQIHPEAVLKAPLGTSGRGLRRVRGLPLEPAQEGWLRRVLAQQGEVVVAPWLKRVADLSFHFDVEEDGVRAVDWSRFLVSGRGQYEGTVLGRRIADLPLEVVRFVHGDGQDRRRLPRLLELLATTLGPPLAADGYRGPVGIDAFIYEGADGLRLHPLVELNPRWTMGRLGLALERHVARGRTGIFALVSKAQVVRAGHASLADWAAAATATVPVDARERHVHSGVLLLTDPEAAETAVGVLAVGGSRAEAAGMLP